MKHRHSVNWIHTKTSRKVTECLSYAIQSFFSHLSVNRMAEIYSAHNVVLTCISSFKIRQDITLYSNSFLGYCARFSEVHKRIINDPGLDCTQFEPPCPPRLQSYESYKCMWWSAANVYCIQSYFRPVFFSPFFLCKRLRPVLNSLRCSYVKRDILRYFNLRK